MALTCYDKMSGQFTNCEIDILLIFWNDYRLKKKYNRLIGKENDRKQ